ncbi:MAG: radical SAM protein [Chlorobiales bacterium]|nr:radical SAM protein [Chlorobiales bacterium]
MEKAAHKAPELKEYPSGKLGSKIVHSVDRNPFPLLYVDLTHRCNYNCNYCYNPVRSLPDMSLDYFKEVCRRLPGRVAFRFMGGEPTLHPQFLEFITTASEHNHMVSFVSNGTMLADSSFVRALKSTAVPVIATLSMNGGTNNEWYRYIDNDDVAEEKLAALKNLNDEGIGRIAITAIIVRDVNEEVVEELMALAGRYKNVRYIHYRSIGKVGRFIDSEPYTLQELKLLVDSKIPHDENYKRKVKFDGLDATPGNRCFGCMGCYEYRHDHKIEICLIDFAKPDTFSCWKRGKLIEGTFQIETFFENMVRFSSYLGTEYPEHNLALETGSF